MGSNMQRQAVPLLLPEAPVGGTGIEHRIATILDSDRQAKTITLRIDSLDASTMRQTQIDDQTGQEMAQSICRRLPN